MPVETRSFRNTSAVGRFPSVTLSLAEDDEEELEEQNGETENACRSWLLKICPCCRRRSQDNDDVTETLETVDAIEDEDKDKETGEEKPDGSEIDGKPPGRQDESKLRSEVAANILCLFLQSSSSECNPLT